MYNEQLVLIIKMLKKVNIAIQIMITNWLSRLSLSKYIVETGYFVTGPYATTCYLSDQITCYARRYWYRPRWWSSAIIASGNWPRVFTTSSTNDLLLIFYDLNFFPKYPTINYSSDSFTCVTGREYFASREPLYQPPRALLKVLGVVFGSLVEVTAKYIGSFVFSRCYLLFVMATRCIRARYYLGGGHQVRLSRDGISHFKCGQGSVFLYLNLCLALPSFVIFCAG